MVVTWGLSPGPLGLEARALGPYILVQSPSPRAQLFFRTGRPRGRWGGSAPPDLPDKSAATAADPPCCCGPVEAAIAADSLDGSGRDSVQDALNSTQRPAIGNLPWKIWSLGPWPGSRQWALGPTHWRPLGPWAWVHDLGAQTRGPGQGPGLGSDLACLVQPQVPAP